MTDPEPLDPWTRIDVSGWKVNLVETAGSTAGMWLIRPGTTQHWLCKFTTMERVMFLGLLEKTRV